MNLVSKNFMQIDLITKSTNSNLLNTCELNIYPECKFLLVLSFVQSNKRFQGVKYIKKKYLTLIKFFKYPSNKVK